VYAQDGMMIRAIEVASSRQLNDLAPIARPARGELLPGQVQVRMEALALNFRDLLVATAYDRWASPDGRVLGSDGVGIVTALGPGAHRFRSGDRVLTTILPNWMDGVLSPEKSTGALGGPAADGVFAEQVQLQEAGLLHAPAYLSSLEAATLPVAALTAWHALGRAQVLRPRAKILIEGAGGVSLFALQIALAAGAEVIAVGRSDEKLLRLQRLGASAVVNSLSTPGWGRRVWEMTAGGVDAVIDIGGASTLNQAIDAAAFGGTVAVVGLAGGLEATANLADIFRKNLRLEGIETGSRRMLEEMIGWLEQKCIRPIIDRVFAFDDCAAAFRHLHEGSHFGKVAMQLEVRG
jgi:NADPH:quinone reductase-like Zn-dependent oxidoreductase